MKFLFVHLSDLHIRDNTNVNLKIDKIVSAVQSLDAADKYILICSGDLAFSGLESEYKCARTLLGALLEKLGRNTSQYIQICLVPGNHDITFPDNARSIKNILGYYKSGSQVEAFSRDLKLQDNFFRYAKSKGCFCSGGVVDSRIVNYKGYKVQYNLLNTAPFSTLKKDNKEVHYLPDEYMYTLVKKDNVDLAVTVMHHSTEWFHEETKGTLETVLCRYSDIIFQGHEHTVQTIQTEDFILSKGGEFSGKFTHKSTFSVLFFDSESRQCVETEFEWRDEHAMFCKRGTPRPYQLIPKKTIPVPDREFTEKFYEDIHKISKNVLDYFAFPKLYHSKTNTHDDARFMSEDALWSELVERKIINISGKSRSGKTTILKYLYNQCVLKGMIPLYLGSDVNYSKSIDKVINDLFSEQYGKQQFLYDNYEQTNMENKIIFIDDLDLINHSQKKLLDFFSQKVAYIVYTSKKRLELDIIDATKEELLKKEEFFDVKIEEFYKEKRTELVSKICKIKGQGDPELLNYLIQIIDNLVRRRNGLFELTPEYIVQYVKFFLNKGVDDNKGEAIFNIVFETNLRNAILEYSKEKNIDYCMVTLEEIAFYMHMNTNEYISYSSIVNLIDELNRTRGLSIDIVACLDIVLSAKVVRKAREPNMYEFSNLNYLAYFIAKKLNRFIERDGFNIPELRYVFKNICFGINDNILLFLSFLRDNTTFALSICEMLSAIIDEYPELDFDQNNISFIKRQRDVAVSLPTPKEKQEVEKASEDLEKHQRENESSEIRFRGAYDYNEEDADTFINRIVRAIKYLQIISKSLISHFVNLELSEKQKIIELMYSAPNRILYAILKPADEHYDETIDELKKMADSIEELPELSRQEIEVIFAQSAVSICLGLYNDSAFYGANCETLKLLNAFELKNSNYKIVNLIMEENGGTTSDFVEKAIELKDRERDVFITNLIRLIARKHIFTRTLDYKTKDRIADKIFSSSAKKQLLVSSMAKTNKKE